MVAEHYVRVSLVNLVVFLGVEDAAEHLHQRFAALSVLLVNRIRVHPRAHIAAAVGPLLIKHDQLVRALDRQLAQQNLVDQREDGRVRPNSERQRQDGDNREQGTAEQSADGELEVVHAGG